MEKKMKNNAVEPMLGKVGFIAALVLTALVIVCNAAAAFGLLPFGAQVSKQLTFGCIGVALALLMLSAALKNNYEDRT